jgi:2-polyprenyl-6-methoxyphenol hydroxylase-like FAD-dependent oxidoreductase
MHEHNESRTVDCCIAGGGPAGVVLGLLLARQGREVLLLEAHQDFDRDFRGDTVHPSTVRLMEQLGLLDRMLELPHATMADFPFHYPDGSVSPPPNASQRSKHPYSYHIRQKLLLDLLVREARRYPSFHLVMGARVDGLIEQGDQVCGLHYTSADGVHEVHSPLVVGADGRFSKVRQLAGIRLVGSPGSIDVLWLRLPHGTADPERAQGLYLGRDGLLVVMDRGDDWQIGYVFAKGAYQRLRAAGLGALCQSIVELAPWFADRADHVPEWRQMSLLSVEAGRVKKWYRSGLMLIGDAAHVMSPVAGVGINYAIQDAIVTSNIVGPRLRQGTLRTADLAAVQGRRELPTRLMQFLQRRMQPTFEPSGRAQVSPPLPIRLLMDFPPVADLRRRLIAFGGWRPERVRELEPDRLPEVGLRDSVKRLARATGMAVWSALCQLDWRAFAVYGGAWPASPTWQAEDEKRRAQ